MSLPPELRNRIYTEVVPQNESYDMENGSPKLPLLLVSKQIRTEAACIWAGNNRFLIRARLESRKLDAAIRWCQRIVETCGPRPFYNLRISLLNAAKDILINLAGLQPLLHVIRVFHFEPDKDFQPGDALKWDHKSCSIDSGSSLFYCAGRRRDVLGRAIALGRRARVEQWSGEKLDQWLAEFVKFARTEASKRKKNWPGIF